MLKEDDKVKVLTKEDRELLTDLTSTFDLGTECIIGQEEDA